MGEHDPRALFPPASYPTREAREEALGQQGVCVWLTGLSASGKTSIAAALHARLLERGVAASAIDGDVLRRGLCADLGFSEADRQENVRRAAEAAALLVDAGLLVTCALISPSAASRAAARACFPDGRFVECFVACPLHICEARDPKGLYARARAGTLPQFTGVSSPYEPPEAPELVLRTDPDGTSPDDCAAQIVRFLEGLGLLSPSVVRTGRSCSP